MQTRQYKLEKNVQIPSLTKKRKATGRKSIYPFKTMQVNDSFFIPYGGAESKTIKTRIYAATSNWKKAHKKDFKFFILDIPKENGIRVWRIN
jgi:hypothetical protein